MSAPLAVSFAAPLFLLLLLLLPIAALTYRERERPRAGDAELATPALMPAVVPRPAGWRRHVGPLAYLLALAALIVAIARPEHGVAVPVEQATVMLVTDRSGSMRATDVAPDRMRAAQEAAGRFLDAVPRQVRVGAIAFNHRVRLLSGPTTDHERVRRAIDRLTGRGSTAAGDALATALRTLRSQSQALGGQVPQAIVLLSDGESVRGRDPLPVAERAKEAGIPIHTIALGTDEGTLRSRTRDGGTKVERVPPDRDSLRQIAERSGGTYSDAPDEASLRAVYERLGSRVATKPGTEELSAIPVGVALVLLLVGAGASLALVGRVI